MTTFDVIIFIIIGSKKRFPWSVIMVHTRRWGFWRLEGFNVSEIPLFFIGGMFFLRNKKNNPTKEGEDADNESKKKN
uniref:Uncharacterized protein n=1 Tax=Lepeophtheirus salmonis TaxID=72036 RepID=A0A0K2T352_LEPSM